MNKIDLEIKELLEEKKKGKITFDVFDRRLQFLENEKQQEHISEQWEQEREIQNEIRGGRY